jgi:energy-coupling factor transporter ATP-binding protein EcfA2
MLELNGISKTFNPGTVNEKKALENVDLSLADGDFATIVGSNGAGKSTLFNAVTGAFLPDAGSVRLDGQDITFMPEYRPQPLHRPLVSGPAARHGPAHDDRGKSGAGLPARGPQPERGVQPHLQKGQGTISASGWRCWTWASRTGCASPWACFRAGSGRR